MGCRDLGIGGWGPGVQGPDEAKHANSVMGVAYWGVRPPRVRVCASASNEQGQTDTHTHTRPESYAYNGASDICTNGLIQTVHRAHIIVI